MKILRVVFLLVGLGLFAAIILSTDIAGAFSLIRQMGWGLAVVLAAYLLVFLGDCVSWQVLLHQVPASFKSFLSLVRIRAVGEAFNYVIPAGGMGGEPLKAVMLKRRFAMDYRDGAASLFATKTVNIIALVVFLLVGFILIQGEDALPAHFRQAAGAGLALLSCGIAGFFLVQRYAVSSALAGRLFRKREAGWISKGLTILVEVEDRLRVHYATRLWRFFSALILAIIVWAVSILEIYFALHFLGFPVSWQEAWMIEAGAQLVKAGTFFIPASLGALDGTFIILCSVFTGSPTAGVAVALVRRFREILWAAVGMLLALRSGERPVLPEDTV